MMGVSFFSLSFSIVSLSSLRSSLVPTRMMGVLGQWCLTSGYHCGRREGDRVRSGWIHAEQWKVQLTVQNVDGFDHVTPWRNIGAWKGHKSPAKKTHFCQRWQESNKKPLLLFCLFVMMTMQSNKDKKHDSWDNMLMVSMLKPMLV